MWHGSLFLAEYYVGILSQTTLVGCFVTDLGSTPYFNENSHVIATCKPGAVSMGLLHLHHFTLGALECNSFQIQFLPHFIRVLKSSGVRWLCEDHRHIKSGDCQPHHLQKILYPLHFYSVVCLREALQFIRSHIFKNEIYFFISTFYFHFFRTSMSLSSSHARTMAAWNLIRYV